MIKDVSFNWRLGHRNISWLCLTCSVVQAPGRGQGVSLQLHFKIFPPRPAAGATKKAKRNHLYCTKPLCLFLFYFILQEGLPSNNALLSPCCRHRSVTTSQQFAATTWPQSVIFFSMHYCLPDPYHGTPIDCSVTCDILINYPHGLALNSYNLVRLIFQYPCTGPIVSFICTTYWSFWSAGQWHSKTDCFLKPKFALPSHQRHMHTHPHPQTQWHIYTTQ